MITEITIRQLRELKGYSQVYLAYRLGISQPAYSKIESGFSKTKESNYNLIASILEVDHEFIIANKIPVFIYVDNKIKEDEGVDKLNIEVIRSILSNIIEQRELLLKLLNQV